MGNTIKTTALLSYIELFNKYEYLIDKCIMKNCPEFINNEDFKQDAKLELLEYIKNTTLNRYVYQNIYKRIDRIVKKLSLKYSGHNTDRLSTETMYDLVDKLLWSKSEVCEIRELIDSTLDTLSDIEAKVIRLYFFDDLTLREISNIRGVKSSEGTRRILARALRKLRYPSRSRKLKIYFDEI